MNGLTRRVEALESRVTPDAFAALDLRSYDSFHQLADRIGTLAQRYAESPAAPVERQSQVERIVRAALGAADVAVGAEYSRLFWQAIAAGMCSYKDGRAG